MRRCAPEGCRLELHVTFGGLARYHRFDDGGSPNAGLESDPLYTWAVRDGDVVVPEPSTLALVGLGLGGLGLSRRRHARA